MRHRLVVRLAVAALPFVLLLLLLTGCGRTTAPPYSEADIVGRLEDAGFTILQHAPLGEAPEYGGQMVSLALEIVGTQTGVWVLLYPTAKQVDLERIAPMFVSVSSAKGQESIYQANNAIILVLSLDDAIVAKVKQALPVTKAYHYRGPN